MTTDKLNKLYIFKYVHGIPVAQYHLVINVYERPDDGKLERRNMLPMDQ
jgi:hypothetical protein